MHVENPKTENKVYDKALSINSPKKINANKNSFEYNEKSLIHNKKDSVNSHDINYNLNYFNGNKIIYKNGFTKNKTDQNSLSKEKENIKDESKDIDEKKKDVDAVIFELFRNKNLSKSFIIEEKEEKQEGEQSDKMEFEGNSVISSHQKDSSLDNHKNCDNKSDLNSDFNHRSVMNSKLLYRDSIKQFSSYNINDYLEISEFDIFNPKLENKNVSFKKLQAFKFDLENCPNIVENMRKIYQFSKEKIMEEDFRFSKVGPIQSFESYMKQREINIIKDLNYNQNLFKKFKQQLSLFRSIGGDGNCFYRAVLFSYLQNTIFDKNASLFLMLIEDLKQILTKPENEDLLKKNKLKKENSIFGLFLIYKILFDNFSFNFQFDTLDDLLIPYYNSDNIKTDNSNTSRHYNNSIDNKISALTMLIILFNTDKIFDLGLILYLRIKIKDFIEINKNKLYTKEFSVKLGNLLPYQYEQEYDIFDWTGFYNSNLLKLYTEAENIIIYVIPFILKININIYTYDIGNSIEEKLREIKCHLPNKYTISMLYRKMHYEIIYSEEDYFQKKQEFDINHINLNNHLSYITEEKTKISYKNKYIFYDKDQIKKSTVNILNNFNLGFYNNNLIINADNKQNKPINTFEKSDIINNNDKSHKPNDYNKNDNSLLKGNSDSQQNKNNDYDNKKFYNNDIHDSHLKQEKTTKNSIANKFTQSESELKKKKNFKKYILNNFEYDEDNNIDDSNNNSTKKKNKGNENQKNLDIEIIQISPNFLIDQQEKINNKEINNIKSNNIEPLVIDIKNDLGLKKDDKNILNNNLLTKGNANIISYVDSNNIPQKNLFCFVCQQLIELNTLVNSSEISKDSKSKRNHYIYSDKKSCICLWCLEKEFFSKLIVKYLADLDKNLLNFMSGNKEFSSIIKIEKINKDCPFDIYESNVKAYVNMIELIFLERLESIRFNDFRPLITKNELEIFNLIKSNMCLFCTKQLKPQDSLSLMQNKTSEHSDSLDIIQIPCKCCFCNKKCMFNFYENYFRYNKMNLTKLNFNPFCLCGYIYNTRQLFFLMQIIYKNRIIKTNVLCSDNIIIEKKSNNLANAAYYKNLFDFFIKYFNHLFQEKFKRICTKCGDNLEQKDLLTIRLYLSDQNLFSIYNLDQMLNFNFYHIICYPCIQTLIDKRRKDSKDNREDLTDLQVMTKLIENITYNCEICNSMHKITKAENKGLTDSINLENRKKGENDCLIF